MREYVSVLRDSVISPLAVAERGQSCDRRRGICDVGCEVEIARPAHAGDRPNHGANRRPRRQRIFCMFDPKLSAKVRKTNGRIRGVLDDAGRAANG